MVSLVHQPPCAALALCRLAGLGNRLLLSTGMRDPTGALSPGSRTARMDRGTCWRCGGTNLSSFLPFSCLSLVGLFSPGLSLHAAASSLRLVCFCLEMGDESEGVGISPCLGPLDHVEPQPPVPTLGCLCSLPIAA